MTAAALLQELRDLADRVWRRSPVLAALAFAVAAFDGARAITPVLVLGTAYLLGPYGLLTDALDDLPEPDDGGARRRRQIAIAATNLPPLVVLVVLGGAGAGLAFALAVAVAIAASSPQVRALDRVEIRLAAAAMLVVLPAVAGSLTGGRGLTDLPWPALFALGGWVVAAAALREASVGRLTAIVAIVAFFVSAALVAAIGPFGALAAFALDLFLLLPAMILTADQGTAARMGEATERAIGAHRGLSLLVGGWLALLVTRHWGLWTTDPLEVLIVVASALTTVAVLDILLTWLLTRRRRVPETAWDADIPSLTIVVPGHDDPERLDATIASLRDQTYADSTILVVDDGATIHNAELATELVGYDGRVLVAPARPVGWSARSWARRTGADAATTDLILFVDPDTTLVPVAIRKIVEQAQRAGVALLSATTARSMPTGTEMAVGPGFDLFRFGFVPIWLAALTGGRPAGLAHAPGAMTLVTREAYATVPADHPSLSDDDLARALVRAGHRVVTVHAADLAATRGERSVRAMIAGWRRVLLPAVGGSLASAVLTVVIGILAFVVPLALPVAALFGGAEPRLLLASCTPLFLLLAFRIALTLTQRQSPVTILTHPLTVIVALVGQLAAIVDHVTGRHRD